ncbi:MAG: hypothetical protein RL380_1430 [Verrucomicrobiota bacterium]|jgi:TolA-binding protein
MKTKVHAIFLALVAAGLTARAEDAAAKNTLPRTNAVATSKSKADERRTFVNDWRTRRAGQTNPAPITVKLTNNNLTLEQRRANIKLQMQRYRDQRANNPLLVNSNLPPATNVPPAVQP